MGRCCPWGLSPKLLGPSLGRSVYVFALDVSAGAPICARESGCPTWRVSMWGFTPQSRGPQPRLSTLFLPIPLQFPRVPPTRIPRPFLPLPIRRFPSSLRTPPPPPLPPLPLSRPRRHFHRPPLHPLLLPRCNPPPPPRRPHPPRLPRHRHPSLLLHALNPIPN